MLLYLLPNALSPGSIVIIVIAALILFGGGKKISELMRGTGKGIKEFKKALKDDEEQEDKD